MPEIHEIFSVSKMSDDALMIDAEFTGVRGERLRANYVYRPSDEFGMAPYIRTWMDENDFEILPYTPPPEPTPEELRALMPKLAKWRVHAAINLVPGLREKIDAEIDAMPEPGRTINKSKLDNVIEYDRLDPLFDLIGTSATIWFSPEDIDEMWMQAAEF